MNFSHATWFKSSWSHANSDCVEVAFPRAGDVGIRDSKNPAGPTLVFSPSERDAFVAGAASQGIPLRQRAAELSSDS